MAEGFAVRLVDAAGGEAVGSLALQAPGAQPPFNIVNDARWQDNERLLISSHSGTAVDVLWQFDTAGGSLRQLTEMTLRYAPGASMVAFEQWRRGGTRVGAVNAAGAADGTAATGKALWLSPEGSQFLNDAWDDRLLLTVWPARAARGTGAAGVAGRAPELVLWPAGAGNPQRLLEGAGWGSWSPDHQAVAALAVGSPEDEAAGRAGGAPDPATTGRAVEVVVLDAASGGVTLRIPSGRAPSRPAGPGGGEESYWSATRPWFESRRPRWSPLGNRLAYLDSTGSLWVVDVPGRRPYGLWPGAAAATDALGPLAPAPCRMEWSADGRFIAVVLPVRPPGSGDYRVEMTVLRVPEE